ncbi:hypothetical protein V5799_011338 [Amblyomma americanum]|uniref:Caspase n=1 Tax=Amblyomma americanum TaxID=6943 RepID=A0AAQ4EHK3_AMBAM
MEFASRVRTKSINQESEDRFSALPMWTPFHEPNGLPVVRHAFVETSPFKTLFVLFSSALYYRNSREAADSVPFWIIAEQRRTETRRQIQALTISPLSWLKAPAGNGTEGDSSEAEFLVTPAKEWKRGPDIYYMGHRPRGLCIIINNNNFQGGCEERRGSDLDVKRVNDLFRALHFKCVVHKDLSARSMKEELLRAAQPEHHQEADCLVVILMSHGRENEIFGSDGNIVHLHDDVYTLFNNENCPTLQGKPKIFFVQACRGMAYDTGTKGVVRDMQDGEQRRRECPNPPPPAREERVATWSDMYFVYSTIHKYISYRNNVIGLWLMWAVCSVFRENACEKHLEDLMHLVQDKVLNRSSHDGCKQTAEVKGIGWRKSLYFNPGLYK